MRNRLVLLIFVLMCPVILSAQKAGVFELKSPDSDIVVKIEAGAELLWSVRHQ